jgi:MFS family permease
MNASSSGSTGTFGNPGRLHGVCARRDLADRFGPRWVVMGGAFLVAISWAINSTASSLPVLYTAAAIGGIGTGCPGRRGLAAGITAAGLRVSTRRAPRIRPCTSD